MKWFLRRRVAEPSPPLRMNLTCYRGHPAQRRGYATATYPHLWCPTCTGNPDPDPYSFEWPDELLAQDFNPVRDMLLPPGHPAFPPRR